MSKNISVKINSGNETVETVKLNATNKKVIIKAQPNVNYELVDDNTQYAPETIDTKRIGNDLHIAFEGTDINQESDLVLEGYYENNSTELLLGKAENGQYYAYVPQSGVESDAVTLLAEQVFAPQALGGNSVATPFWAFNPNWLWAAAGVAAVGGIVAAASGGKGSSNPDTAAPAKPTVEAKDNGSVEVTPPADADTKSVEVSYTDEAGTPKTATLTKGEDGNWTSNNPDVAVDPATGKATILADKVKDGSPVTAKATDTAGNAGEEGTVNAGNNPDTTAPAKPTVEAKDNGSVEVTPPADADTKSVEVGYTDEAGTPKTATLTKGEDGTWTSNNPDGAVDPATGKATIPADKVKDGSPVTAKATDTAGNAGEEGTANAGNNPDTTAPAKPTVEAKDNGSVEVTPPADADTKSVEVGYTDEAGTPKTATLAKGEDGNWTSNNPDVAVDPATGKATIPADKVKDGSPVTAKATDTAGNTGEEGTANAGNKPDTTAPSAPEVTPSTTDGSVAVKVPGDAEVGDTVEVTVTPEGSDTPEKVTLTKQADGSWTSDKPETVPSVEAGKDSTTIPQDKVKDGSEVTAQAKDPSGNESTPTTATAGNDKLSAPTLTANDDGSVVVNVPTDAAANDTVEVTVTPDTTSGNATPVTVVLTKQADGSWTSSNEAVVPNVKTGESNTIINKNSVEDLSKVSAITKTPDGRESEKVEVQALIDSPSLEAANNGDVIMELPSNMDIGDSVALAYMKPDGTPTLIRIEKMDGSWDIFEEDISGVSGYSEYVSGVWAYDNERIIKINGNKLTLSHMMLKDNTEVATQHVHKSSNIDVRDGYDEGRYIAITDPTKASKVVSVTAGEDVDKTAPSAPEVTPSTTDGSVTVKVPSDAEYGDTVEITVTPEGSNTPKKVTLTKEVSGGWNSDDEDIVPNIEDGKDSTTIPEDKVKDGSEVTAKAKDPAGNESAEAKGNAGNNSDTTAPAKPTVEAKDNGSVEVTPPADADTKSVEVGYTDEADTPKTATLTKGADGTWTSNNPDVAVDPVSGKATIPADKVQDGSPVTAKATDTAGNTGEEGTANAGNNPDTTAPGKPTIEAKMNGFVYITPPADEDTKSVEVHYIDEEGNPQTVTITKDADKGWVSSDPYNIWVTPESGLMVLTADKVKDGSPVRASATDNQGNIGEAATENAVSIPDTYGPSMPEVVGLEDRSARVTMPQDANVGDFVVIKRGIYQYESFWAFGALIPDDDNDEILATLTKQQDGSWISDKPENVPNVDAGNDNTIVPANKLKGFGTVYARAEDPAENFSAPGYTNLASEIASPTITVKTDGFVEITPPAVTNLKSMAVRYLDKSGTRKTTMLTKDEDGNWTSDNPDIMVEPATGKAIISSDKIKGGSQLAANAFDTSGIISYPALDLIGKNTDTTAPSAPEVIPSTTDGSVTVKVPDDAKVGDDVSISVIPNRTGIFLNPENSNISTDITLIKKADGSWSSSYYSIVPEIEAGQNSTTIPQDQVKDGSYVIATSRDLAGNQSVSVRAQAGEDTKDPDEAGVSSNTIDSNGMGSSGNDYASFEQIAGTINMGAGNDILEARSTDFPFTYLLYKAKIDMGSGDDIVRTSGPIQHDSIYKGISIDGGDDFDTLEFVNRDGEAIMTSISAISNFEKIDIKGTLNNTVNIHKDDVERNHNAKATVDDSGKSHNNVLIVDGNEGDKVNLSDISKAVSSQVNYEGKTYHVYHTGSNELWIDSDIAVV